MQGTAEYSQSTGKYILSAKPNRQARGSVFANCKSPLQIAKFFQFAKTGSKTPAPCITGWIMPASRSFAAATLTPVEPKPTVDEPLKPGIDSRIVNQSIAKMGRSWPDTRQSHAVRTMHRPTVRHRKRHLRMKLDAERCLAIPERLVSEMVIAGDHELTTGRHLEAFPVPLVDVAGPVAHGLAYIGRKDRIIADFGPRFRMQADIRSQALGQQLRPQTDAQKWRFLAQGHIEPINLAFDEFKLTAIIGAHRPAEDNGAFMFIERFRQCMTKAGAPDVKFETTLTQLQPDTTRCRRFLMYDDENSPSHLSPMYQPPLRYIADNPPSSLISAPVTKEDSSLAR